MIDLSYVFPWFGGKSLAAPIIWEALGDVRHYVEPFAGSLAVLLNRPSGHQGVSESVNDIDCFLANFWRATQHAPELVLAHCESPMNEADLVARNNWLVSQSWFRERMFSDPTFFSAQIAGWWLWGVSAWIGAGWCQLGRTAQNKLPDLVNNRGIFRLELQDKEARRNYFEALQKRLKNVKVACGDWTRVLTDSALRQCDTHSGVTGVLLDPPYAEGDARYSGGSDRTISTLVRQWAIDNGDRPELRIVLCGLEGEHTMPSTWRVIDWESTGGFARRRRNDTNRKRERIWLSPACLGSQQLDMFANV